MSRYNVSLPTQTIVALLTPFVGDIILPEPRPEQVGLAIGYDAPCAAYFMDIEPDCEQGLYYGFIGLTRQVSRSEMVSLLHDLCNAVGDEDAPLHLRMMLDCITLDIPF